MAEASLSTGIEMYYETHGEGEAIILSPATGFSADVWLPFQVSELSKSHQVVIFDPRGVGRTTHYEGVYTIDQMSCDLVALMDHLGVQRAHIVGHSMGGRVALATALNFPRRVTSLVMAASGAGPSARPGDGAAPGLYYNFVKNLLGKTFEDHIRHFVVETGTYFTADFRRDHPERVREFFELAWKHHARWPEYLRQTMGRDLWEVTHRLGDLSVPTLVVVGDADGEGSDHVTQARPLRERIRGVQYRELKGQAHGFFWQNPAEINALLLDWVRTHTAL